MGQRPDRHPALTNLGAVPDGRFRFTAAPPKVKGMGTFPVRAFALIEA